MGDQDMNDDGVAEGEGEGEGEGSSAAGLPKVFYRIDSTKVTEREYRANSQTKLGYLAAMLMKISGKADLFNATDLPIESLAPFQITAEELPAEIQTSLVPALRAMEAAGFHSPTFYRIDEGLINATTFQAVFAHHSLPVIARMQRKIWSLMNPPVDVGFVEFVSMFSDGTFLWTTTAKQELLRPESCRINRVRADPAVDPWAAHQAKLKDEQRGRVLARAASPADAELIVESLHAAVRDFHMARGVFRPLTDAERELASTLEVSGPANSPGAAANRLQLVRELDRSLRPRSRWSSSGLFVITLILFLVVGLPGTSSFTRLLAIVPILLFHECGHFVAMRLLGYQDVRMFFIPGFGAAVHGRSFTTAGWKRCVVSLMGPLPGIIVGVPLAMYAIVSGQPLAREAAMLLLLVNGFNLLPFWPLDGGHVLHTVLFARNFYFDVGARVLGGIAFGLMGVGLGSVPVGILGGLMLVGLPSVIRTAKVARALRSEGFVPSDAANDTIPTAIAQRIADLLVAQSGRPLQPAAIATETRRVYESLNTRAPGWLASIGILGTHLVALWLAAALSVALIVPSGFYNHGFNAAGPHQPLRELAPASTRTAGTAIRGKEPSRNVVARFKSETEANAAFTSITAGLKPGQAVTIIGETLIIGVGSANKSDANAFVVDPRVASAKDIFVDGEQEAIALTLRVEMTDPQVARAVCSEIRHVSNLNLKLAFIPPWSTVNVLTPEQLERRKLYSRMMSLAYEDAELDRLEAAMDTADTDGNDAEYNRLLAQRNDRRTKLFRARREHLASSGDPATADLAKAALEACENVPAKEWHEVIDERLAPKLGQVLSPDGGPDAAADPTSPRGGNAYSEENELAIFNLRFNDPHAGASAFIAWLETHKPKAIRVRISGGRSADGSAAP